MDDERRNEVNGLNEVNKLSETEESAPQAAGQENSTAPAEIDYSIATGAKEEVIRRTTNAYNTSDSSEATKNVTEHADETPETFSAAKSGFEEEGEETSSADAAGAAEAMDLREQFVQQEKEKNVFGKINEKRKDNSGKIKRIISVILIIVLCGAAGFGGGALATGVFGSHHSMDKETIKIDASDVESLNAASAIAKKVMPSVVGISTVSQTYTQTIFGLQQGTQQGVGTGLIVTEDGYILTNSHVVNDGESESITVDLYDGSEYTGTVLWNSSDLDLAIVKIDAKDLPAAELGDSDEIEIGDYAVAIGNPLGLDFERSVTQGIVSGLDRTITTTDTSTGTQNTMEGLIQTDASINSGNSGGPLINSEGKVFAINSAKASSAEGLGFAIPINTAMPIIKEIKENGTYEQSYVGISGMDVEGVKAQYQTDFNADEGIYIMQIYTNSPASKAGLQEGDIITAINDEDVEGMSELKKELVKYRPGDVVTLTIERDKKTQKIQVTLEAASSSTQQTLKPAEQQESNGSSGEGGNNGSMLDPYNMFGDFFK